MMASIDQIRTALTMFYDQEIKPTLPDVKGKLYGVAVGVAMAKPEATLSKIMPAAKMMGIIDEGGMVALDILARELKKNVFDENGKFRFELKLNPFRPDDVDVFIFTPGDIDKLLDIIRRL